MNGWSVAVAHDDKLCAAAAPRGNNSLMARGSY